MISRTVIGYIPDLQHFSATLHQIESEARVGSMEYLAALRGLDVDKLSPTIEQNAWVSCTCGRRHLIRGQVKV